MLYRILIFRLPPDLAPCITQVAGFHRAVPSTALDKAVYNFLIYYIPISQKVKPYFDLLPKKLFINRL